MPDRPPSPTLTALGRLLAGPLTVLVLLVVPVALLLAALTYPAQWVWGWVWRALFGRRRLRDGDGCAVPARPHRAVSE